MRTRLLAPVCGIQLVSFWPVLIPWQWTLLPALLLLLIERVMRRAATDSSSGTGAVPGFGADSSRCGERIRIAARLVTLCGVTGLVLLGVSWHLLRAGQHLEQRLPAVLEGEDLPVSGTVVSLPESRPTGQRFEFLVDAGSAQLPGRKLLLNHYGLDLAEEGVDPHCAPDPGPVRANQRWQFTVRLQRPHGFANPGTFDYEAWLFQQRLSARGYVRPGSANLCLGEGDRWLLGARSRLRSRILAATEDLPFQSVILALTLGDRSGLSEQQWDLFTATGTNHLVVISGLHVALLAGLAAGLTARVWRTGPRLVNLLPAQQAAALMAIAAALIYSLLAGFALPTQRALVMVSVFMSSRLLGIHTGPLLSLLLALLVVSILDPLAATGAGFWLSFSAVATLLLVFSGLPPPPTVSGWLNWRLLLIPQLVVFAGLLVPLGFWLGQVSLVSPLANGIAIPVVSWLVVPLCLAGGLMALGSEAAAAPLFSLANLVFSGLFQGLGWLRTLPDLLPVVTATLSVAPRSGLLLVAAALGSVLLILPGAGSYRGLAALLLAPWLWPADTDSSGYRMEVHVLDVGQGLSVIVRAGDSTLVYDTGPRFASGFDSGEAIVAPVLRWLGVSRVDTLVVSHGDNDHAGGVHGLMDAVPVGRFLAGESLVGLDSRLDRCRRGQRWRWNQVSFEILYPPTAVDGSSGNNSSCVLLIKAGDFRVLLPGDIEGAAERRLLASDEALPRLDLLVSAHHGSNTSSSSAFVARTSPALVIHSAGYRNQFGHPAGRVRQRFARLGSQQLQTAELGMISVFVAPDRHQPEVRSHRHQRRRYWHWSENR